MQLSSKFIIITKTIIYSKYTFKSRNSNLEFIWPLEDLSLSEIQEYLDNTKIIRIKLTRI